MANRPWLDDVRRRLAEGRLPDAYIRRFTEELSDHLQDLMEETMNRKTDVSTQLGEPDQVAAAAIEGYRRQTFLGRHPTAKFWVFGVLPGVSMFLAFVLACLGLMAIAELFETSLGEFRGSIRPMLLGYGVSILTTVLPAVLLTILFCVMARRFGIDRRWMFVACVMLAAIAMLPIHRFVLSTAPGASQWSIGLSFPPNVQQGIRFLIPMAVGLWFLWRTRRQGPCGQFSPTT